MEKQDTDDLFDSLMVFFANTIRPFTNEFFKLMEWLLVISALSFASQVHDHIAFKLLKYFAIAVMYAYVLVGYLGALHDQMDCWTSNSTPLAIIRYLGCAVCIIIIAAATNWLAVEFADKLSMSINS